MAGWSGCCRAIEKVLGTQGAGRLASGATVLLPYRRSRLSRAGKRPNGGCDETHPNGEEGRILHGRGFYDVCRQAIDRADAALFGATSGPTPALRYLRWERDAYANVRPVCWMPGYRSPLRDPEGLDFAIVRENSEDLYVGVEGDLADIRELGFRSRITRAPIPREGASSR